MSDCLRRRFTACDASAINNVKTAAPECRVLFYGGLGGKVITLSRGWRNTFCPRRPFIRAIFSVCDVFVLAVCVI